MLSSMGYVLMVAKCSFVNRSTIAGPEECGTLRDSGTLRQRAV